MSVMSACACVYAWPVSIRIAALCDRRVPHFAQLCQAVLYVHTSLVQPVLRAAAAGLRMCNLPSLAHALFKTGHYAMKNWKA